MFVRDCRKRIWRPVFLEKSRMSFRISVLALLFVASTCLHTATRAADEAVKPLKVLLVCGGCCHDYTKQKELLKKGLEARANVEVTTHQDPSSGTKSELTIYKNADWAKEYDAIIHDECFADVKDVPFIEGILKPHKEGKPAVLLHCAMHCYRSGTDMWFKFCGIQSSGHGPQLPIAITFTDKEHPATKGIADWTTIKEELYNNLKLFETAKVLARGKQVVKDKEGKEKDVDYAVVWANEYDEKKTRVFATTIGHNNDTVGDARYLDMVTRGLLWSMDKLNDKYLKAAPAAEPAK